MSKVKDLVTVSVDSAFINFPIDQERYELLACVAEVADHYLDSSERYYHDTLTKDGVQAYVRQVEENFLLGASSLAHYVTSDDPERFLSAAMRDRASRTKAALWGTPMADLRGPRGFDDDDLVDEILKYLWMKYFICLARASRRQQLSR